MLLKIFLILDSFLLKLCFLFAHLLGEPFALLLHLPLGFLAIQALVQKIILLALELFSLSLAFFLKLCFLLGKLCFSCSLLSTDLLLLCFKLCLEIFVVNLEFVQLVSISFLVCGVPVVRGLSVDHWVTEEVVLMRTDKDAIAVLQDQVVRHEVTIDLDWVLVDVIFVRDHRRFTLITVEIEAALSVGDTDTRDRNLWTKLSVLFTDKVVALEQGEFYHATHGLILVDIAQLGGRSELLFLLLTLLLFSLLLLKLPLELCLLSRESSFLLLLKLE